MKRFTVPCDFNGVKHPFHVYIGEPHPKKHPLQFQAWWLSTERGGTIPQDVMDSFEKLFKIAQENNVSFEDLCVYALGTASEENSQQDASGNEMPMDTPGMDEIDEYEGETDGGSYDAAQPEYAAPQEEYAAPQQEYPAPQEYVPQPYAAPEPTLPQSNGYQESSLPALEESIPKPKRFEDE